MVELKVTSKDANQRADKYIKKYLVNAPLSFIYKLFRKKDIKVNSHWVKQDYLIQDGDIIRIYIDDEQVKEFCSVKSAVKKDLKYPIIYEDENILIINKPRGILVHGDKNEKSKTLANDVLNYLYFKGEYNPNRDKAFIPSPAHRLDRNTSGLVIFGKNVSALQELQELFKNKNEIEKSYLALVVGSLTKKMEIDSPLLKDSSTGLVKIASISEGAKSAYTIVSPLKQFNDFSLVEVQILTGRTHQIRVHLSSVNYPVVGDSKYGNFSVNKMVEEKYHFSKQFLHAYKISFKHVVGVLHYLSNKSFVAPLSKEEKILLDLLA